jgi:SAM-dependent methyltransferase
VTERQPYSLSTDIEWERWGRLDPYFGVITHPRFRRACMTAQDRVDFFKSGQMHVQFLLQTIRRYIDPSFVPESVLDFGCGVGRMLLAFAEIARDVVGLDVAPSMLHEARRNCDEHKVTNVRLLLANSTLSAVSGTFNLIHSFIVFQHISPELVRDLVSRLVKFVAPGGVCCLHFLYSKIQYAETHGIAPIATEPVRLPASGTTSAAEPEIQMNPCNMNEILFLLQGQQVKRFHAEYTDHGGELGLFIFFQVI